MHLQTSNRWDALELMDSLLPFHPYLVQTAPSVWEIHAAGAEIDDLHDRIRRALERRRLDRAEVTLDDGTVVTVAVY